MSARGACACGAVRFTATVTGTDILACHCSMCRALNAGPFLSVDVANLVYDDPAAVATYVSSAAAQRPFCPRCGSSIAWVATDGRATGVAAFLFDPPLALRLGREVFCDDKPTGYAFAGVPQR